MSLNLDKSTWERVAFGDVIDSITDRVDDPSTAGVDRYVGLEHLDPGIMTVERWDTPDKVAAQKLRFRSGDVIFGRRRAYQKKVALAGFEGICSAHALVLRARPGRIDPDFLPVFLSSDYFLDRAIEISVGSLSPTVNWRDLRGQEFTLPPLDEQKRIADLLWAIEHARAGEEEVDRAVQRVLSDFCLSTYRASVLSSAKVPITEIADLRMGRQKSPKYATGEHPTAYLRVANIGTLELNLDVMEVMEFSPSERAKFELRPGDVVLTEGDIVSPLNVGRPALFSGELSPVCFQNTLIRLRPINATEPKFLLVLCEGMRLAGRFAEAASTTTVTHLGLGRLSAVGVPLVEVSEQRRIAAELDSLLRLRGASRSIRTKCATLRHALVAEIFGDR